MEAAVTKGNELSQSRPTLESLNAVLRAPANVQAGLEHVRLRDVPDILDWKDFAEQPEETCRSLQRRRSEGRIPGAVASFPLPKPGRSELRRLAQLHPLDDLWIRVLVDQLLAGSSPRMHDGACSARLTVAPPGWRLQRSNEAWNRLRRRASMIMATGRYATLVKCDVRRCYPSMSIEVIERALRWHGIDAKSAAPLLEMLGQLRQAGAPKGLPIGPEASAVVAGLVLAVVDSVLSDAGIVHLRYSDDTFIFVPNGSNPASARESFGEALDVIELEANAEKYEEHSIQDGSAWSAIQDPEVSDLQHDPDWAGHSHHLVVGLEEQMETDAPNWTAVSFCIGGLRHRNNARALPVIYAHPEIFHTLPRQTGRYLVQMCESEGNRSKIDQDWLAERATTEVGDGGLAAQLHACRVGAHLKLGKPNGTRFESMVSATDRCAASWTPVRAAAALAWGSSRGFDPRRAEEFALELGNYDVRRALVAAVAGRIGSGRRARALHQKLRSADPDLDPILSRLV